MWLFCDVIIVVIITAVCLEEDAVDEDDDNLFAGAFISFLLLPYCRCVNSFLSFFAFWFGIFPAEVFGSTPTTTYSLVCRWISDADSIGWRVDVRHPICLLFFYIPEGTEMMSDLARRHSQRPRHGPGHSSVLL